MSGPPTRFRFRNGTSAVLRRAVMFRRAMRSFATRQDNPPSSSSANAVKFPTITVLLSRRGKVHRRLSCGPLLYVAVLSIPSENVGWLYWQPCKHCWR